MLTNLYCKGPQKNHIHNHNTREDKPTRGNPGPEHPTPGSCSCYLIVVWINIYIYINWLKFLSLQVNRVRIGPYVMVFDQQNKNLSTFKKQ